MVNKAGFNQFVLARVFRARLLDGLNQAGLPIPGNVPKNWVVDCCRVGHGEPALKYLSRYLYRGVIAERDILANRNGKITFRYVESETNQTRTRTLPGADFLWLILQHVLPKGFRRVRDYGFLHGNAKKLLGLVQLILQVKLALPARSKRPKVRCPECGNPMHIASISRIHWQPG